MSNAAETNLPFEGPIPRGNYTAFGSELSNPCFLWDIARNLGGDWGDWRVPLHPSRDTETFGRSGFFLHGGTYDGSAGCIDIGGSWFGNEQSDRVLKAVEACRGGLFTVEVAS